jgi:hypothetical protein
MTFSRHPGTRVVPVPVHMEFEPLGMHRYELSRMRTPRDCSREICMAVKRSTTRISPPQHGHVQAVASPLREDATVGGVAASKLRQSGSISRRRR